jgi:hypothetical protein
MVRLKTKEGVKEGDEKRPKINHIHPLGVYKILL